MKARTNGRQPFGLTGSKPRRSHAVFANIGRQKEAIKRAILEGRGDRISRYVDDLVAYQLKHSEREDVAKSLCDLATYAKSLNTHGLQLELAQRAASILPTDGWSQAQLGDANLCLGRYQEAFVAYAAAASCGQVVVARTGRGGGSEALGRLDEALREYEAVVRRLP